MPRRGAGCHDIDHYGGLSVLLRHFPDARAIATPKSVELMPKQPEELAVMMARRQIERAQVAILVVDASAGVTSSDLAIAGTIWELGRAAVVAVNKWDLLDEDKRAALELSWERLDQVLASPARVNVSALSGRGVEKLFPQIDHAL